MDSKSDHIRGRATARDFSTRILVVDDDELELALMSDRLTAAGLEVVSASNGAEALEILGREWFPVVLTDWRMPVMDGMQLIDSLRSKGGEETYIIMFSAQASAEDFERGYRVGVDDYMSKKSPDVELLAHIEAGFTTVMLRRSLKQVRGALAAAMYANSEKHSDERATIMHLQAELMRAVRYHRLLSTILVLIEAPLDHQEGASPGGESLWRALMLACGEIIRVHIDWIGRLDTADGGACFAIILPETGSSAVPGIQHRICETIRRVIGEAPPGAANPRLSIGSVSIDSIEGSAIPDALQFLAAARACLGTLDEAQPGASNDLGILDVQARKSQ